MEADVLTRPVGSFGKDDVKPGMAFFQGTGPAEMTCGDCLHRGYRRESATGRWDEKTKTTVSSFYRVTKCAVFKSMTGRHGGNVDKAWRSCKYFEQKPKN